MGRIAWGEAGDKRRGVAERRARLERQQEELEVGGSAVRVSLIQALIPLGLRQVEAELQAEVAGLAGRPGQHGKENRRWGRQGGSVYLLDQKVPVLVPRVRNKELNREVPLASYRQMQAPYRLDEGVFLKLLNGLSTRRYRAAAGLAPEVFGLSASSVSRRFRRWSAAYLERLMTRRLEGYDLVAVYLDGKAYATEGLVIALGVTIHGEKVVLGLEQMNTENSRSVSQFLGKLIERGLRYHEGLLVVVDGSKGLITGVREKLGRNALIQRCQQHKKENVVSYLAQGQQKEWRIKLGQAYGKSSYGEALAALNRLHQELDVLNPSAAASLREGMAETLTLHRLGLADQVPSLASTNGIESLLSHLAQYTDKVDRWRNGRQIQEWAAAGLLQIEPRLRKLMGYRHLPLLRERLRRALNLDTKAEPLQERELVGVEA